MCLRGAFPPVFLRAVCLVRAMVIILISLIDAALNRDCLKYLRFDWLELAKSLYLPKKSDFTVLSQLFLSVLNYIKMSACCKKFY
jgi:hypothetical protein